MINTDLIVRSAKALVEQRTDEDIYMEKFLSDRKPGKRYLHIGDSLEQFPCKTTTCWAGSMPFLDIGTDELKPIETDWISYKDRTVLSFIRYSERILGTADFIVWRFLFSGYWPNITYACLERAEFLHYNRHLRIEDLRDILLKFAADRGVEL